jgi:hypothetical protein
MLPPPYVWRIEPDRAFLDWNYGNVANVQQHQGRWELNIRYQGVTVMAPCGSLRQGIRYAERWILARGADMPGLRWRSCKFRANKSPDVRGLL